MPLTITASFKKIYGIIGISIFILIIGLFLVIYPLQSKIAFSKQDIHQLKVKLKSIQNLSRQDDLVKLSQSVIENDELRIDRSLLPEKNTLEFITSLEAIAEELAINNQQIALADFKTTPSGYKTLEITLNFVTDFQTFTQYLAKLESLPYYLNISSLKAAAQSTTVSESEENALKQIEFNIVAKTYWQ